MSHYNTHRDEKVLGFTNCNSYMSSKINKGISIQLYHLFCHIASNQNCTMAWNKARITQGIREPVCHKG